MRHCDPINALYRLLRLLSPLMLASVLLAAAHADVVTYFHNDIAGTPMAATDANGHLLWKESYRPYGERLLQTAPPSDNALWFSGKPQDPATGLSYLGARYYNPQLGRFMGIDPKEVDPNDLHSFNRYAYGNNNPYKFVDPDGNSPLDMFFLAFDVAKLGVAIYTGVGVREAVVDVGLSVVGVFSPGVGVGEALKAARLAERGVEAAKVAERGAEVAKRTFSSTDKYVADVANKIEEVYPGHVIGVNVPVRDTAGNLITDADILLKNAVIQVKSGGGKGMTSQLQRTEQGTGLPTIGYGPDLKQSVLKNSTSTNDLQTLIDVVKP